MENRKNYIVLPSRNKISPDDKTLTIMRFLKQFTIKNFWFAGHFSDSVRALNETFGDDCVLQFNEGGTVIIKTNRQKCACCGEFFNHNGTYKKSPVRTSIVGIDIRIGQQYCLDCQQSGKVPTTILEHIFTLHDQWQKNMAVLLSEADVSDERISTIFRDGFGVVVTGHTVNNWVRSEVEGIEVASPLPLDGSVAEYDEQWVKENGIDKARIVIKKYKDKVPLFDEVFENATKEKIIHALKSVPELKRFKAFVMDMAPRYPETFKALFPNAKIQWCLFHLNKLIFKEVKSSIIIGKKSLWELQIIGDLYRELNLFYHRENELEWIHNAHKRLQKFKDYRREVGGKRKDIDNDIRDFERQLIQEFWKFLKLYKLLRRRAKQNLKLRTLDDAIKKIKELYEERGMLSLKVMRKRVGYIVKNLGKFTPCLNDYEIPSTNNGMEAYFSSTLQKKAKKDFRSEESIKLRIKLSKLRKQGLLVLSPISLMQLMKYWHWFLSVFGCP